MSAFGRENLSILSCTSAILVCFGGTFSPWRSEARGGVIYVNGGAGGNNDGSSWSDAFVDLQDAFAGSAAGDDIWVAGGTYAADRGTGDVLMSFEIPGGVSLYGSFVGNEASLEERNLGPLTTVLSGNLVGGNTRHVTKVIDTSQPVLVSGFVISDGVSVFGGGGMRVVNSTVRLEDVELRGNRSFSLDDGGGGALFCGTGATVTVLRCLFDDNWILPGAPFTCEPLPDCFQVDGGPAGAVRVMADAHVRFDGCAFTNNRAGDGSVGLGWPADGGDGGAIFSSSEDLVIANSKFDNNRAGDGAAGLKGSGDGGSGGAIRSTSDMVIIEKSVFIDNRAGNGGGHDEFGVPGCGGFGGAVHASVASIHRSEFLENRAGALCCLGGCDPGSGGAIWAQSLTAINCVLALNEVGSGPGSASGGALGAKRGVLRNCTFVANGFFASSGSAVNQIFWPQSGEELVLENCVFAGNETPGVVTGAVVPVMYSLLQEPADASGEGNVVGDPMFVDSAGGDYRVLTGSPAIDAGDPSFSAEGSAVDLAGNPRVLCSRVDMGAYEYAGFGQINGDETVDVFDFDAFSVCQSGPGEPPSSEVCDVFDTDCDGDVDFSDFGTFQLLFGRAYP